MRPKLHREAKSKIIPKVIRRNTPRKVKQKKTKNSSNALTSHPTGEIPNEVNAIMIDRELLFK